MPYTPQVLELAQRRYKQRLHEKQRNAQTLQEKAYALNPRIAEIDLVLQETATVLFRMTLQKAEKALFDHTRAQNMAMQEERRTLLISLGMNPEDLTFTSFCQDCHDSGWQGRDICHCLQGYCVQSQLASLAPLLQEGNRHSFESFDLDYYSTQQWAGSPCSPRENMQTILQTCKSYAQHFKRSPLKNLLFSGSPGLGKTFLAAAIAKELTQEGYSVVYDTAEVLFEAFNVRQFRKNNEEDYSEAKEETRNYLNCDLLVLDDLGAEFANVVTDTSLYEVVNSRLLRGFHTIITTNLAVEELENRYPPQVLSRIKGEYTIFNFFGDDVRQLRKQRKKADT